MSRPLRRPVAGPPRQRVACLLGAMGMLAMAPLQAAATCDISVQPLNFGSYDFQRVQDTESVGHVLVTCDARFTIKLSPGGGTVAARTMQNASHPGDHLKYNLYTDVTHTHVWGDDSGGDTVTGTGTGTEVDLPVYGRIPADQNLYIGTYTDTITVTLSL